MGYITQAPYRLLRQIPDHVGTIDGNRKRKWRKIVPQIEEIAGALREAGISANDRVALLAPNSDIHFDLFMAVLSIGAVFVPLNTRYSQAELNFALNDCGASILFGDAETLSRYTDLDAACPSLGKIVSLAADRESGRSALHKWADGAPRVSDTDVSEDRLAVIMYTGGTTGRSKGVMLSQSNLLFSSLASISHPGNRPGSAYLHTAPLFHVGALAAEINTLLASSTQVYIPAFEPLKLIETVELEEITDVFLVPTMLHAVLNHPEFDPRRLERLSRIIYGGAAIDDALLERCLSALPQISFVQCYGMTELSPVATILGPEDHTLEARQQGRGRSAGRATVVSDIRIVHPDGNEVARNSVGEVTVRGPHVMLGYWQQPEATKAAIKNGFMHTGDLGRMDEDGYVTIVDRLKDMIITGGENVYSAEVENVLCSHPSVERAAVIGLRDETWGEVIHAVVVPAEGATPDAESMRNYCRTQLAGYKVPKAIAFASSLPLSPAGKVLKHELRALYNGDETK